MPPILSRPSNAARTAVLFITVGALTDVWSGIWWMYLIRHSEGTPDGVCMSVTASC
jgi:hypothetical protein